ncbi:MAG: AraC family transcriptional regulator [Luteibacter sp.]
MTAESALLTDRFRLDEAPTLVSSVAGVAPLPVTRLRCRQDDHGTTAPVPASDGYAIHMIMDDVHDIELSLNGKAIHHRMIPRGGMILLNMDGDPSGTFHRPFNFIRFGLDRLAIEQLCLMNGQTPPARLARVPSGTRDDVLLHLADALSSAIDRHDEVNQLYLDQVMLAVHARIVATYGNRPPSEPWSASGGLAPWQVHRSTELVEARLDGKLSVTDLARESRLSPKHYTRAFRQTFGMPPYRYLLVRRVERAKQLLLLNPLSLADIALRCGFAGQSHFNRIFMAATGRSPGAWRSDMGRRTPFGFEP